MAFKWDIIVFATFLSIQVIESEQYKLSQKENDQLNSMRMCEKVGNLTDLHKAVMVGNYTMVEDLLARHAKVDAKDKNCLTPLYRALENNHTAIKDLLIKHNANVDIKDDYNETLLFKAIKNRDKNTVLGLLQAGARINASGVYEGYTPLHKAVELKDLEIAAALINHGAEVNSYGYETFPLLIAVKSKNKAMINLLLDNGAKLKPECLWWAVIDNRKNIALLLLEKGADPNLCVLGSSPLHSAVNNGKLEMAKLLLDKGANVDQRDREGNTPLSLAAFYGKTEIIKLLINSSADINTKDQNGNTPLHNLCDNIGINASIIEYMIMNGADINATNIYGQTPLNKAILSNGIEIVKLLVQKGARLDSRSISDSREHEKELKEHINLMKLILKNNLNLIQTDKKGMTLLEIAVMESKEDIAKYLLSLGAELNPKNAEWTPLHVATMMNDVTMMEFLIRWGADINGVNNLGWTPLHAAAWYGDLESIELLLALNVSINSKDYFGWTPLHIATKYSKLVSVRQLLQARSDVNSIDLGGFSPLNWVEAGGHPEFLQLFLNKTENITQKYQDKDQFKKHIRIIKLLLDNRCDVNHKDRILGWSTLHWAAASGHMRSVKLLVENGATINIKSKLGQTPANLARKWGREKVYDYLKLKGGE